MSQILEIGENKNIEEELEIKRAHSTIGNLTLKKEKSGKSKLSEEMNVIEESKNEFINGTENKTYKEIKNLKTLNELAKNKFKKF